MKYPRAAMVHKFLFMMLVELAPYTRGTLSFLPISHEAFRLLMDIVRDEHNIPLYNEMRSYALDYQGIIDREHTNYDIIGKRTKVLIMMLVNSFYMFNGCDERYFNLYKDKIRGIRYTLRETKRRYDTLYKSVSSLKSLKDELSVRSLCYDS